MPRYAAPFTKTGSDSVLQIVEVLSSGTVQRTKWFNFGVKNTGTETADTTFSYIVRRVTASATGTSLTPSPFDSQDAACRATSEHLITADHASFSSGAELFRRPVNNRATYDWYASEGRELVGPATSASGLSLGVASASTSTFAGTVAFEE
jgi:hypothetical protein